MYQYVQALLAALMADQCGITVCSISYVSVIAHDCRSHPAKQQPMRGAQDQVRGFQNKGLDHSPAQDQHLINQPMNVGTTLWVEFDKNGLISAYRDI